MRLRIANALFYALLATFAAAALTGRLRGSVVALVEPFSYVPTLQQPALWLSLAALLVGLVFVAARRLALDRPIGMQLYVALLVTVGLCVSATRLVPPARRVAANEVLDHLVARVEATADAAWAKDGRYPDDKAVFDAALPEGLREPGFRARPGTLLRSEVHLVRAGAGPQLSAPDDVRPGDVVIVVDADRRRYWITAFTLDRQGQRRPLSSGGRVLIAAGVEGRASLQQDPLFPDYPRKSSGRGRPDGAPRPDDANPPEPPPDGAGDAGPPRAAAGIAGESTTPNPIDAREPLPRVETRDRPSRTP